MYGLHCAFLVAGAETLVASLWRVSDAATVKLMPLYYQRLLDKQRPDDRRGAMVEAMQELRRKPGRSHPYYSAPFLVVGSDGPLHWRDTVGAMDAEHVDTPTLRRLLAELLRTVPELDAFCLDYFPEVHRQLAPGMERTQRENLLLQQAPSPAAIVQALQAKFADAPIWTSLATEPVQSKRAAVQPVPWLRALLGAAVLGGMALAAVVLWGVLRSPQPSPGRAVRSPGAEAMQCGALALDDVFVVRESRAEDGESIQLDLRLRHIGTPLGPVNLSRVQVDCSHRIEERAPLAVSATYDLRITGEHNEAALAQRLSSGEVDRIVLRLGFTQETAAYQYTATLRLLYNGTCTVESAPFTLSRDAARQPALVAPWPGKPAQPVRP